MHTTVITIANHKGGVGKTTTAVTLATGLAALGHPVVLIDCDPQGNCATFLDLERRPSFYELVIMEKKPKEVVQTVEGFPNLGVVTGDAETRGVENTLNNPVRPQHHPKVAIATATQSFQGVSKAKPTYIIIDTAPSLSAIQFSALNAADWLLIPTAPEYPSEAGMLNLMKGVRVIQKEGGKVQLLGVLPTLVDTRTSVHVQGLQRLEKSFETLLFPKVRRLTAVPEAIAIGKPIWTYAPQSDVAKDYGAVLAEFCHRMGVAA